MWGAHTSDSGFRRPEDESLHGPRGAAAPSAAFTLAALTLGHLASPPSPHWFSLCSGVTHQKCSGVTPGSAQGTYGMPGIEPRLTMCKTAVLPLY